MVLARQLHRKMEADRVEREENARREDQKSILRGMATTGHLDLSAITPEMARAWGLDERGLRELREEEPARK